MCGGCVVFEHSQAGQLRAFVLRARLQTLPFLLSSKRLCTPPWAWTCSLCLRLTTGQGGAPLSQNRVRLYLQKSSESSNAATALWSSTQTDARAAFSQLFSSEWHPTGPLHLCRGGLGQTFGWDVERKTWVCYLPFRIHYMWTISMTHPSPT